MKNHSSKIYKILNISQSSAGFTLIELLVAIAITSIVVSLTGFGLVAMTNKNKTYEAETQRRTELNRALDFIADEVRMAKSIKNNASTNLNTLAPSFISASKTPVLTLELPNVSERIIYYIKSPVSTEPWLGPKVIYRWGPNINDNGQYTNASNPSNWQDEALVDVVANITPEAATTCLTTGWSANPSTNNGQGFTACVDPTGKIAEIYLRGTLTGAVGTSLAPYQVNTRVFARSSIQ